MSLSLNKNLFNKISFRLTYIYILLFVISNFFILLLNYFLFEYSLKSRDHDLLNTKAKEYSSIYLKGGVDELNKLLIEEKQSDEESQFLVRIASEKSESIFLHIPEKMQHFNIEQIEKNLSLLQPSKSAKSFLIRDEFINTGEDDDYELININLPNGQKIQVARNTDEREDLLERYLGITLAALVVVLILGSIGGFIFSNRALAPLRSLIQTMKRIYSGELNARVPIRNSNDELDEIGKLFNKMTHKIERLILNMQETLDYVAHDLKTPLTRLKAKSELLLLKQSTELEYKSALADTIENTTQIVSLINTIMDISEAQVGVLKLNRITVNSRTILSEVQDLYSLAAEEKNISLRYIELDQFDFSADQNRIKQILSNIFDNAIKYSPAGSQIEIISQINNSRKEIIIKDQGMGISSENLIKIWDRLFRAEEARQEKGLGLGLSLVKSICKAHGWEVHAKSQLNVGSEFILMLGASS